MSDTQSPESGITTDTTTGGGDLSTAHDAKDSGGTEATAPASDTWENFDADRAKRTIENQRKVEAELKRQNAEMRAKLDEVERSRLSDEERAAIDLEKVKTDILAAREELANARFEAAAVAAGIPSDRMIAARAVAADVIVSDESGNVSIDTSVFDKLKERHGYLFTASAEPATNVSFGAASGQGFDGQGTGLTPEQIEMAQRAGMSIEDFAKYAKSVVR